MNFNNFIKNELERLFNNIAYKMEAEKLFVDSIKEDKFYYIEDFTDGVNSNLFDKELSVDAHISLFKSEKLKSYIDDVYFYNVNVILQKNGSKFNLLFLAKKPIVKKFEKDKAKDSLNSDNLISKFTSMFGGKLYKVEYSNLEGGKIYTESELEKINRRDKRRSRFLEKYRKNKTKKEEKIAADKTDKYKKKKLGNKFTKKEVQDIVGNKCKKFNSMYENENILMINVFDIPEVDLVENIVHSYYIILFGNILPNLFNDYKNIKKVEKLDIEFNSLINFNKILKDSLKSIFFVSKNDETYKTILNTKSYLHMLPYEISNIDVIISNANVDYSN
jgi:hypothetical protein